MRAAPRMMLALIGLCLVAPLLVVPSLAYPTVTPKVTVLCVLVEIMAAVTIAHRLAHARGRGRRTRSPYRTPITIALFAYFVACAVSGTFGVDVHRSFWDWSGRMLGVFALFHYVAWYLILITWMRDWSTWRWVFAVLITVGTVVVAIGCVQRWGDYRFYWNVETARVTGSLGRPGQLGALGIATIFSGLVLIVRSRLVGLRILGAVGVLAGLTGAVICETRGTTLGLLAGAGVLATGAAIRFGMKRGRGATRHLAGCAIVVVATIVLLISFPDLMRSIPGLRRFPDISMTHGTLHTRLAMWDAAFESFQARPVLGWGPNNFYDAFNAHFPPELLRYGWDETWFDDAHNAVINTLCETGLIGLGTYAIMLGAIAFTLLRATRSRSDGWAALIILAYFVAHFTENLALFDGPTSLMHWMVMVAFANTMHVQAPALPDVAEHRASTISPPRHRPVLTIIVAVGTGILAWRLHLAPTWVNHRIASAIRHLEAGRPSIAIEHMYGSQRYWSPHRGGLNRLYAQQVLARLNQLEASSVPAGPRLETLPSVRLASALMQREQQCHPNDVRATMSRAKMAVQVATLYSMAELRDDSELFTGIEDDLWAAHRRSPRQESIFLLASLELIGDHEYRANLERYAVLRRTGRDAEADALAAWIGPQLHARADYARELLQTAIDAAPEVAEGWWRLALVHSALGDVDGARGVLIRARNQGVRFNGPLPAAVESLLDGLPEQ